MGTKNVSFKDNITYRPGTLKDMPAVLDLIKELADFEKEPEAVTNTVLNLEKDGFGKNPVFKTIIAEENKKIIAFSLCYIRYSTWKGRVLYLEDLYVKPEYRGYKVGSTLFSMCQQMAKDMECRQMQWQVLDWNVEAIKFYKNFEAQQKAGWLDMFIEINSSIN